MIKNNFMNKNIGIWNKKNGMEWGKDLQWSVHSKIKYQNPAYAFAVSEKHPLQIEIEDFAHPSQSLCLKKFTLQNESREKQDFTFFFKQDFEHCEGTAFFSISERTLYHEYEGCYMLFNGFLDEKGISQYTTWQKNDFQNKPIVNVETGSLFYNPISAGRVESAFALETTLLPYEIKHGYYWVIKGKNLRELNRLNQLIKENPEWLVREFIENDCSNDSFIPLSK